MKDLLVDGEKSSPPRDPNAFQVDKYGPNWPSKELGSWRAPKEGWTKHKDNITKAAEHGEEGSIVIDFRSYDQELTSLLLEDTKEQIFAGANYIFGSVAFMISTTEKFTSSMYLGEIEVADAKVFLGGDRPRGFLDFVGKDSHGTVEIEDFYMLAKLGKFYIFTCFNKQRDLLFTQAIPSLENIDLSMADNGKMDLVPNAINANESGDKDVEHDQTDPDEASLTMEIRKMQDISVAGDDERESDNYNEPPESLEGKIVDK